MEDHRAAVRYDLLKHGYRLEDLGTERLWWPDAIAIIEQQPPATSAVFRALYPDKYDRDKVIDRLETIAVFLVRGQQLLGNQTEVDDANLPSSWDDLWKEAPEQVQGMSFEEIDSRMGWAQEHAAPAELLSMEEIDQRMGW